MDFTTKMKIENFKCEFEFSCSYENFSKRVTRVTAMEATRFLADWYVTLQCSMKELYMYVELVPSSIQNKVCELQQGDMLCRNINGDLIVSKTAFKWKVFEGKKFFSSTINLHGDLVCSLMKLPKDTLILEVKFIFSCPLELSDEDYPIPQHALKVDLKNLYLDSSTCDVSFIVENRELKAHKSILESRSPVFSKMFKHDMLEKNTNQVNIEDISPHVFDCFLYFLYSAEIKDKDWDTVIGLFSVACKYQVPSLAQLCADVLIALFTVENICSALIISQLHTHSHLETGAVGFTILHLEEVLSSEEWEKVEQYPALVTKILKASQNIQ